MATLKLISRYVRPKRAELVAIIAISITCFIFMRSRESAIRLQEMESTVNLQSRALGLCQQISDLKSADGSKKKHEKIGKYLEKFEFAHIPEADQINNTKKAQADMVFFNRVPKVGSQMLMDLARRLSVRHNYGYYLDRAAKTSAIRMTVAQQRDTVARVHSLKKPAFYSQHVGILNFTQYGLPEPIYINMVRDPIERVISWFYYIRAAWYITEMHKLFPDLEYPTTRWLKKDFEECVRKSDPECLYVTGDKKSGISSHLRQTMFFCGHDELCMPLNTDGALQKAKKNVEQKYAVVGVLEYLNETMTVLEHYVPRYFAGISQMHRELSSEHINRNSYKPPVSEEVKDILREKLSKEMEFFQFCKQRLHLQLRALRLPYS